MKIKTLKSLKKFTKAPKSMVGVTRNGPQISVLDVGLQLLGAALLHHT